MSNLKLMTTPEQLANSWGVYKLINIESDIILYLGIGKLSQLFTISEARANPFFHTTFKNNETLIFELADIQPTKAQAMNSYSAMLSYHGMPAMIKNQSLYKGVECINTGERFPNISACAQSHGIDQGALSKHLRGTVGYRTLKGKMYKRIG